MASAYDSYDYPKYWRNRDYEHQSELIVLNDFLKKINNKGSIIDIGAGHGRLCFEYADKFKKITLADPSSRLLRKAKNKCGDKSKNITYIKSTVESLSRKVKTKKYDVALMVRVLHHIDRPSNAFEVVSKILKKDGYFILEFANKVHGKEIMKRFFRGDFTFILDIFPNDKRSSKNIKKNSISFLNHHPDQVEECLKECGFEVVERRSVSNIRSSRLKRKIPLNILTAIERFIQKPLSYVNFGPSIFILARKK